MTADAPRSHGSGRDFVEALARGLDVLRAFGPTTPRMSVSEVADRTGLARPTARRLLLTLEELGYLRSDDGRYEPTPRVFDLGTAYVGARGLWDVVRPHLEDLVGKTSESSSMAELDGSDIVYVGRVAVPKIIALAVRIGTRFPVAATSMGRVLLADLPPDEVDAIVAQPTRSGLVAHIELRGAELHDSLAEIRERGWALSDELLAPGVRSVATAVRGLDGRAMAAVNVTVHAAETSVETLTGDHLPLLLQTAERISADWAARCALPIVEVER